MPENPETIVRLKGSIGVYIGKQKELRGVNCLLAEDTLINSPDLVVVFPNGLKLNTTKDSVVWGRLPDKGI